MSTPPSVTPDPAPADVTTAATAQAGQTDASQPPSGPRPVGAGTFWEGRSGLVMPVVIAAFSLYILIGVLGMDADDADFPGPRFFPAIVAVVGLVLAVIIAVGVMRQPDQPENTSGRTWRFHSDYQSLGWAVGGFLAFAVLLPWLGWILAGALLFWCVAHGFGSRKPLFDILLALFLSSVVYLAFDVALGLNLPSGILGGGF